MGTGRGAIAGRREGRRAGARRAPPTPQVANARRYAARVRILLATTGAVLLALDPSMQPHPLVGAIGCAVLGLTGLFELFVRGEGWLGIEESLSCAAAVCIVGFGEGRITGLTLLWLSAAAVGVLARGGRVGGVARLLVAGALISPVVISQTLRAQDVALMVGALMLLLAVGRISRETTKLLLDPLTGVLSRAPLRAEVARVAARARTQRSCSLIMVDFDDFGIVNKRSGYAAGDAMLVAAAHAMQDGLAPGDLLGRMGGDEFAVLSFAAEPMLVAQAVIDHAAAVGVRACAGVAVCPADGRDDVELLSAADFALRMAKRDGKDRVVRFEGDAIVGSSSERATLLLERLCSGEGLEASLLPIVALASDEVWAHEVLVQPEGHDPAARLRLLTLAEGLGMREDFERACLRRALELGARVPDGARLSIRLPVAMLRRRDLALLLGSPGAGAQLTFTVYPEQGRPIDLEALEAIAELRRSGARFALGGVGGGQAELTTLEAVLRPELIRLEPNAMRDIERTAAGVPVLAAVAENAHRRGAKVLAVGIETELELEVARDAGVDYGQGAQLEHGLLQKPIRTGHETSTAAARRLAV